LERYLFIVGTLIALRVCIEQSGGRAPLRQDTVKRPMKLFILIAIFSTIAAASWRQERREQPNRAT
jgi:hypothetical protein